MQRLQPLLEQAEQVERCPRGIAEGWFLDCESWGTVAWGWAAPSRSFFAPCRNACLPTLCPQDGLQELPRHMNKLFSRAAKAEP